MANVNTLQLDQWRRTLDAVRLPHRQIQEMMEASRRAQQFAGSGLTLKRIREIADMARMQPPPNTLDALRSQARHASVQDFIGRSIRVPDQRWSPILRASLGTQQQLDAAIQAARLSPSQWQQIIEATRMPNQQWRALIEASRLPRMDWQRVIRQAREAALASSAVAVAQAADVLDAELADVLPAVDPEATDTSWLLNLPFAQQVKLLMAVLGLLSVFSQWLTTMFTEDEMPAELTQPTVLLLTLAAVLSLIVDMRGDSDDE
jgi:hypothetical protein